LNAMKDKRMGKLIIPAKFYLESKNIPEFFQEISFKPYEVKQLFYKDAFELIGSSPAFDVIEEGGIIPEYTLVVTTHRNKDGSKELQVFVEKV